MNSLCHHRAPEFRKATLYTISIAEKKDLAVLRLFYKHALTTMPLQPCPYNHGLTLMACVLKKSVVLIRIMLNAVHIYVGRNH